MYMIRPEVSESNYNNVFKISGFPQGSAFDYSLTHILKKFRDLEKKQEEVVKNRDD